MMVKRGIGVILLVVWSISCVKSSTRTRKAVPDPVQNANAELLLQHGYASLKKGDSVRAEQYFLEAIGRGASERKVMPWVVRSCLQGMRLSAALSHAVPYLEAHPRDWPLRYVVATTYYTLGDFVQAEKHLLRVHEEAPKQSAPVFLLGEIYREDLDRVTDAAVQYRAYLEMVPNGEHADEAKFYLDTVTRRQKEVNAGKGDRNSTTEPLEENAP